MLDFVAGFVSFFLFWFVFLLNLAVSLGVRSLLYCLRAQDVGLLASYVCGEGIPAIMLYLNGLICVLKLG